MRQRIISGFFLVCLSFMLSACVPGVMGPTAQKIYPAQILAADTQTIIVNGDIDLNIIVQADAAPSLQMARHDTDLSQLVVDTHPGALTLGTSGNVLPQRPLEVQLILNNLQKVDYQGTGNVRIQMPLNTPWDLSVKHATSLEVTGPALHLNKLALANIEKATLGELQTQQAKLSIKQVKNLTLKGNVQLAAFDFSGQDNLNIVWLDTPRVVVHADGNAHITLAGRTEYFIAQLHDHAVLNARYLRAHEAFIRTDNQATAAVWVNHALHAQALNQSRIQYYRIPDLLNQYQRDQGQVLFIETPTPPCVLTENHC